MGVGLVNPAKIKLLNCEFKVTRKLTDFLRYIMTKNYIRLRTFCANE